MPLNRLIIYTRNIEETAAFYERHFGFRQHRLPGDRILELVSPDGGANILLHPAAKGLRTGQSLVKLVFDIENVESFCAERAGHGLIFGPIHQADGYAYTNAKDPCQNPIQVSSRAFRRER